LDQKMSFASKMELLQLCHQLDTDGDGTLSMAELRGLCSSSNHAKSILKRRGVSSNELETIFESFGEDVSDGISYHDFVDMMFKARSIDRSVTLMCMRHQVSTIQETLKSTTSAMKAMNDLLCTTASKIDNIKFEAEVLTSSIVLQPGRGERGEAVRDDGFASLHHGFITPPPAVNTQASSALATKDTAWCHTIALLEELDSTFRSLMAQYCEAASSSMLNIAGKENTCSLTGKGDKVDIHNEVLQDWADVSSTPKGARFGTGTSSSILKACECLPCTSLDVESVTDKRDATQCCTRPLLNTSEGSQDIRGLFRVSSHALDDICSN